MTDILQDTMMILRNFIVWLTSDDQLKRKLSYNM